VFSVSAGVMISSGLFVLPAIAFAKAGPAVILSYLLASVLIIPSVLSTAELCTAMPRAGGIYFFIERSFGSAWGLFSGFANWFSLALKSAFAVIGMAIFVEILTEKVFQMPLGSIYIKAIAAVCCLVFGFINLLSVRHVGRIQNLLVILLLVILGVFVVVGAESLKISRYEGFTREGWPAILATAGLIFISFGGLTKVASIAEEVKRPERNIPLGMLLAWFVVTCFYVAVVTVTVGLVNGPALIDSLTPVSLAGGECMGLAGFVLLGGAAVAAFITTANAGILSASRAPFAMSRDRLLPPVLARLNKRFHTPHISIIATVVFMIVAIVFLDIEALVKTASTLMIILFILSNASVIIMRESGIQSYRPKFKSPLYPYMQIVAIIIYGLLIIDMGKTPLLITIGFIIFSMAWYWLYVSGRVTRASAIMHIATRVANEELKTVTLEDELRDILFKRDNIIEDRFDGLVRDCEILDVAGKRLAEHIFSEVAEIFSERLEVSEDLLFEKFIQREAEGTTVIQPGLAIPHIIVPGENKFDLVLVRAVSGIRFPHASEPVKIMFALAGSKDQRNFHLRALMAIAQIVQEKGFEKDWLGARDSNLLRNLILLSARKRDIESQ